MRQHPLGLKPTGRYRAMASGTDTDTAHKGQCVLSACYCEKSFFLMDGIYVVPKGNFVLISLSMSQVDPSIWKDGDKWEPSRWNDTEGMASQALKMYADESGEKIDYGFGAVSKGTESPYQPFGAGKHRCIGEQVCSFFFF